MAPDTSKDIPLIVDVDGTLIRTDLLYESLLRSIQANPLRLFYLPVLLFQGRSKLKRFLAKTSSAEIGSLPLVESVLDLISQEKERGRKVFLASASDQELVQSVGDGLGMIEGVFGSSESMNLKGMHKAKFLVEKFGEKKFDYVGDHFADLPIWEKARKGYVVTSSQKLYEAASKTNSQITLLEESSYGISEIIKTLRPYQWIKNILLAIPWLMAHGWENLYDLSVLVQAFFSFSLVASSVYVLNDLLDLAADREHVRKRFRPLASGAVPIPTAMLLGLLCLVCGAFLGRLISQEFLYILSLYYGMTCLYSFYLKKIVLVDIITLASLYTIRIFAGSVATHVYISQWLLAFSMFIFFSLACVKRYSEVADARRKEKGDAVGGRGYLTHDLECIAQFGSSSGTMAILVLAFYINSREVAVLYQRPNLLWLICPLLFYWISRVWLLASRGRMHDDPVVFALTDRTSYLVGLLLLSTVLFAL